MTDKWNKYQRNQYSWPVSYNNNNNNEQKIEEFYLHNSFHQEYVPTKETSSSNYNKLKQRIIHEIMIPNDSFHQEYVPKNETTSSSYNKLKQRPIHEMMIPNNSFHQEYAQPTNETTSSSYNKPKQRPIREMMIPNNSFNQEYASPTKGTTSSSNNKANQRTIHEIMIPNWIEPIEEFGFCYLCDKNFLIEIGLEIKLKCLHTFCQQCLVKSINENDDVIVCCPFPAKKCNTAISDDEIKTILGDQKKFEEFMTRLMMRITKQIADMKQEETDAKLILINLEKMELEDYNENTDVFECPVCSMDTEIGAGVVLKNCLHQVCKECIDSTVKFSEHIEVKCPFMDDKGSCEQKIQDREIKALASKEVFEKYLEKSLNTAEIVTENAYHCKTPNCNGWVVYDEDVLRFACQVCTKINCIACKVIHDGKTCEEYYDEINPNARTTRELLETENSLKALVASGEAMHCPKCGIIVQKADGCDYLTCTVCKLAICWITRKPRHDLLKGGVLIEGCKCNFNGKRCHPNCGNCH